MTVRDNVISSESLVIAKLIVKEEIKNGAETTTLKEHWIKLGNQLEIDGVPNHKISQEAQKLILTQRSMISGIPVKELYIGSWFYKVYSEHNWTPFSSPTPEPEEDNSSIYEKENYDTIQLLKSLRDWCNSSIILFKNSSFESLIPSAEMDETKLIIGQAIQHANDNMNNKTMIPHAHYPILFREFITCTSGGLSGPYYTHVKKKIEFTGKQIGKIVRAFVQDIPLRYEPQNEDESEACGFSGVQCTHCKFWRTDLQFTDKSDKKQLRCYKCDEYYDAPRSDLVMCISNDSKWG